MRKRNYIPILYTILIFLVIFSFHSYQNLKAIVAPPSEKWGREVKIDKTPYKKAASLNINEENIWILTAKEDRFTKTILEKENGNIKEIQNIIIPGAALNKLVKYKGVEPYIFWTENYELYMSTKQESGDYTPKSLIAAEVKDFNIFSQNGQIVLAAAHSQGLRYYKINEQGAIAWGNEYPFDKAVHITAALDDSGIFHTVSIRDISPMEKEIIYLLFSQGKWTLRSQKTEYVQVSNESIGNLEIGLDNELAYIFYENNVWNSFGQTARTWYATVPLSQAGNSDMEFRLLTSHDTESSADVYVSEVNCPYLKQDTLNAVFIEKYWDETGEGFKILNTTFKDGKISGKTYSTRILGWIKGIDIAQYGKEEALVFLQTAGEFKNDVWFTQTGEGYKEIVNKPVKQDYAVAMENSISPYISGLVIALIRAFMFFPAVLWLLFVEFFEVRKFSFNPKLNYSVAISIYMIIKVLTANFYYGGLSYYMMPDFMKPMAIRYLIMLSIGFIAYFMAKTFKKNRTDMHIIPEFLLFMLYDLLITVFLYGPYIT